jgi:methionyl-tRNA synthetase
LAFLREPLEDLCISRPKSRLTWGITLPFDENYVTYVWFDALINYVSALDYPDGEPFARYWPAAEHLIAKDILKPHGLYWPCMLQAAGIPMYRHLNVHGYWTIGGFKGSKSDRAELQEQERQEALRLFRDPVALADLLGVDGMRYCLLREMAFGSDLDFTRDLLVTRYNADLAHDLGNAVNRTVAMIGRYCGGIIPDPGQEFDVDRDLRDAACAAPGRVWAHVQTMEPHLALAEAMDLAQRVNRYLEDKKPWTAAKNGDAEGVATTLYYAAETLGIAASLLLPAMPTKMRELRCALGLGEQPPSTAGGWGYLEPGLPVAREARLFPAIER